MGWKCRIKREDYSGAMTLGIAKINDDGSCDHIEGPVTIKRYCETEPVTGQPFLSIRREEMLELLQGLVDQAWDIGIRPSFGFESANTAQKAHLEDMRAIVSKHLSVVLPGADG